MLKYLLGGLTFVAMMLGLLFVLVLSGFKKPGMLEMSLMILASGSVARLVYKFFQKREPNYTPFIEGPAMLQTDINNFRTVFQNLDCVSLGITEVKFLERADQTSFFVGLRSNNFSGIDLEVIRKALHKLYYSHVEFQFVDLNSPNDEQLNAKGISIPLRVDAA